MASEMRKHLVVLLFACTTFLTVVCATHSRSHADDDDDDVDHPNSSKYCACNEASMNRRGFPDGFIFGSGSAAYQVEGGYNEDGKGPSMWDHFTHTFPEKIQDGSTGDVAIDSYHLYKEDVQLLKNMGADAYKFSISWSRILPGGSVSKGVNQRGIDYYNDLINELLANDIQPWVTMLHLDTPQALEDAYGGFLSPRIVNDFRDFADVLFSKFGDRVKYWMTINEPWGLSYLGYTVGVFAPSRCSASLGLGCTGGDSATEPYIMTHNQLLAHAAAVNLYKTKYQQVQKGKIGIIVNSYWYVPYNGSHANLVATDRAFDFMLGWVMDPITYGKYPESMRKRVGKRLPEFTKEEEEMVKGSIDFLALNYYSGKYALDLPHDPNNDVTYVTDSGFTPTGEKDGIPIGEQGNKGSWYYTYPKGLRGILSYIKLKYNDPVIYITENGLAEDRNDSLPMSEVIQDYKRKQYLLDHLCCLQEAIQQDGANVKGYFTWSLTDNYQWVCGFSVRFGIHYIDYADKSLKRHPKLSAQWLKTNFARTTDQKLLQTRSISDQ